MTSHLTVRLAWHDHGWDGTICQKPLANCYCCGSHSLLSERLARDKRTQLEVAHRGKPLDSLLPDYLPPCYWSSSAFSDRPTQVVHVHPFRNLRVTHRIADQLPSQSVFTWPFRLSMCHSKDANRRDGKYPADWDARADRYISRLTPNKSLVFFYLNYDNPISADEYKYTLVACARLTDVARTGDFPFSAKELKDLCGRDGMQNFGAANWAIKVSHDLSNTGVRLPYHEYLEHVANAPDDEAKLEEIKVVIEEPALLPGAKYVSEHLSDDAALYLLYKLRRAFEHVAQHGIAPAGDALDRIDAFIREFWEQRGLYPGLPATVGLLSALRDGDVDWDAADDADLVAAVRQQLADDQSLLTQVFAMLADKTMPSYLSAQQQKVLRQARRGFQQYPFLESPLRRLSLFNLTPRQLVRVLFPSVVHDAGEPHPFGGRQLSADDIAGNPYLLCEEYQPATAKDSERTADLDREERTDNPIDYFTIDIGLFPDEDRYDLRDDDLQDFAPTGKERLRAFAVTTLRDHQSQGHTYASLPALLDAARLHPLFYRKQLALEAKHFTSPQHVVHFKERLYIEELDGEQFYYLRETKGAEESVGRFVSHLLHQPAHELDLSWVTEHLQNEAAQLAHLPGFSTEQFVAERRTLIEGALLQRLFLATGRPGSGKTRALREVVQKLRANGERVTILAPTGKATLRVKKEAPNADVETIDRWLSRCGLHPYLVALDRLPTMMHSKHYRPVQNLIIDEASMIDLARLAVVFRALEVHEPDVARVIFVGDENQLPPIGMGRPLYDLLDFLNRDPALVARHVVRLRSNCRQTQDRTVVDAAHLFAGKNRYRTDLYEQLLAGGTISNHLHVEYWETPQQLYERMANRLDRVLGLSGSPDDLSREKSLNLLFNLYDTGYVKGYRERPENELRVDALQLLSPYRGGYAGSIGLNQAIRERYRAISYPPTKSGQPSAFGHSDKIIRISNYYGWTKDANGKSTKELKLSNGSIGIICNHKDSRRATFPEVERWFDWGRMDEEDFEAAYAISVHKAQGSEFTEVFVVIPERRGLLSRELVYTAITRSTGALTLFVQRTPRENPLDVARGRSDLLRRNSSLLSTPLDARRVFEPEPGIHVKSKVEYVIYEALRRAREQGRLAFNYEEPPLDLVFDGRNVRVHPDFTIMVGDRRYYWEHLGLLDRDDYYDDWQQRRKAYEIKGLGDQLITTDDISGIRADKIEQIIADLIQGSPATAPSHQFSRHHYTL